VVPQPRSDSSALPPTKLYAGSYIHATASAQHRLPSSSKQAGCRSTAGAHVLHGAAAASSSAKFLHREENPFCARSARVPMLSFSESHARVALQVSTRMMIKAFGTCGSLIMVIMVLMVMQNKLSFSPATKWLARARAPFCLEEKKQCMHNLPNGDFGSIFKSCCRVEKHQATRCLSRSWSW